MPTDAALDLLRIEEGLRLRPYRCTAGQLTIGYGHNIDANGLPGWAQAELDRTGRITKSSAERLLLFDATKAEDSVKRWLLDAFDALTDARKTALISMAFQLGEGTLRKFTGTRRSILAGDWEGAAKGIRQSKWARQTPGRVARLAEMIEKG